MNVRVLAFARVREALGFTERTIELPAGATAADAWNSLAQTVVALQGLATSTRLARNGTVVDGAAALQEGDELAFLPPVGGG